MLSAPLRALFAVTLLAHPDLSQMSALCCQTAWHAKALPTFADALALVRRWWMALLFSDIAVGARPVRR
jgi:hypothetical protein